MQTFRRRVDGERIHHEVSQIGKASEADHVARRDVAEQRIARPKPQRRPFHVALEEADHLLAQLLKFALPCPDPTSPFRA